MTAPSPPPFQPPADPLRTRVRSRLRRQGCRHRPLCGGRDEEDGAAARCTAPLSRSSPPGVTVAGGEEGEPRSPGGAAGWLPPSLLPALARPAATPTLPGPPHRSEGGSPGLLGGPQTKEGNGDEPGREGEGGGGGTGFPSPHLPPSGRARPPHPFSLSRIQLRQRAR